MQQTALITGATSGIGKETARIFAKNNINLIICGRRTEKLQELKQELSALTKVHTLQFDVRYKEQVQEAIGNLPDAFKHIDILINYRGKRRITN